MGEDGGLVGGVGEAGEREEVIVAAGAGQGGGEAGAVGEVDVVVRRAVDDGGGNGEGLGIRAVSYTHLPAHQTGLDIVFRLLL